MKRFWKILAGVVGLLVVILAGAVVYVLNIDANAYKPDIEQAVKEATGRDFKIDGPIVLDIGTETTLSVEGIRLANAEWGSREEMVTVQSVEAAVQLFSLIGGAPDVSYVRVNGVRAIVETNEDGVSNTAFKPTGEAAEKAEKREAREFEGGGDLIIPVLREVKVEDIEVIVKDAVAGTEKAFVLTALTLLGEGADAPMSLNMDASFDGQPLVLTGDLGSPSSMLNSSDPWPVDIKGNLAGIGLLVNGSVMEPAAGNGFDVEINAFGDELADAAKVAGVDVPKIGAFEVSTTAKGDSDELALDPLNIAIGAEDVIKLAVTGKIASAMEQEGFDLNVSVKSDQIGNLSPITQAFAGQSVPALGALDTSFRILGGLEDGLQMTGLNAKLGAKDKIAVTAKGSIADLLRQKGIDITVAARSDELGNLSDVVKQFSGQSLGPIGPLTFDVRAVGDVGDELALQDLALDLGRENTVKISANGSVADALTGSGANLEFAVVSPDLSALSGLAGTDVPPIGPVDIKGTMAAGQGEPVVLDPFTATIAKSDLSGKVTVDANSTPISVEAVLNSSYFSIDDVNPPSKGGSGSAGGSASGGSASGGSSGASGGGSGSKTIIPDDPLPLEGLKSVNADVTYTADRFLGSVAELENLTVKLVLRDGLLTIEPLTAKVGAGTLDSKLSLDVRESDAKLDLSIKGDKMDVESLLAGAGFKDRAQGPADLDVALTGTGASAHRIAASLGGDVTFSMYDAKLKEKALRETLGDLIVDRLSVENGWVVIDCAVFDYDVANGVFDTKAGYTASGPASVKTSGTIDLAQEVFDLGLKAEGGDVIGIPLIVTGPLNNPSVSPDPQKALLTIGAGILTGGIGPALLTAIADLPEGHPCVQEVNEDQQRAQETQAQPSVTEDPKKALEDAGKVIEEGVGGALKGIFGD